MDVEISLAKNIGKYVKQQIIPVHIAIRKGISRAAVGQNKKLEIDHINHSTSPLN